MAISKLEWKEEGYYIVTFNDDTIIYASHIVGLDFSKAEQPTIQPRNHLKSYLFPLQRMTQSTPLRFLKN